MAVTPAVAMPPQPLARRRIAVVGAGWAGLAAAVAATQAGARVTLWEAAREAGGRARSLPVQPPQGAALTLDNGQHILIGAYRACLALMETVGVAPQRVLRRLPLDLRDAHGYGLTLPAWPGPLQPLAGLRGVLGARGWPWRDRWALLRALAAWQRRGFQCPPTLSVAGLCHGLPERLLQRFVEPLCAAALNTPVASASAQVFLRVLRDSLAGGPGSADLLLPTRPLGELLAEPAWAWLQAHGAQMHQGVRVQKLGQATSLDARHGPGWQLEGECFDAVVLAVPVWEAARLIEPLTQHKTGSATSESVATWLQQARGLRHEAIGTVYLQAQGAPSWEGRRPMLAVHGGAAQFAFDRTQLSGEPGLRAWVASTWRGDRAALVQAVQAQACALEPQHDWQVLASVIEKRATFACTAGLQRPGPVPAEGWRQLLVCGDYVEGPYPATLEGAVRSGIQAIGVLRERLGPG